MLRNFHAPVQRNKDIGVAGQNGAQAGGPELWREAADYIQSDFFLKKPLARAGPGVVSAVSGIQNHAGEVGAGFAYTGFRMARATGQKEKPTEACKEQIGAWEDLFKTEVYHGGQVPLIWETAGRSIVCAG